MKKEWICRWTVGQDEEKKESFKSYEDAYSFIRKLISENADISKLIKALKSFGDFQFTNELAEFLTKYVNDPCFPSCKDELPFDDPEDFEDYDTFPEDDFYSDDDETFVSIETGGFNCKYNGYDFSSDFVIDKPISEDCRFDRVLSASYNDDNNFQESDQSNRTPCFSVTLICKYDWKSSAYPIMVLRVLQSHGVPLKIADIAQIIADEYDTLFERKAIGRHISLLKSLGYNIKHCKEGYYMEK